MANYKGHSLINILLFLPIFIIAILYICDPGKKLLYTFIAAYTYSTLFMSPDLDLSYSIKKTSLRGFLSMPFRLYGRVFRHRGLSHSIVFGTLTRILWLTGCVTLTFIIAYLVLPEKYIGQIPNFITLKKRFFLYKQYIYYAIGGIVCADLGHLIVDHECDKW